MTHELVLPAPSEGIELDIRRWLRSIVVAVAVLALVLAPPPRAQAGFWGSFLSAANVAATTLGAAVAGGVAYAAAAAAGAPAALIGGMAAAGTAVVTAVGNAAGALGAGAGSKAFLQGAASAVVGAAQGLAAVGIAAGVTLTAGPAAFAAGALAAPAAGFVMGVSAVVAGVAGGLTSYLETTQSAQLNPKNGLGINALSMGTGLYAAGASAGFLGSLTGFFAGTFGPDGAAAALGIDAIAIAANYVGQTLAGAINGAVDAYNNATSPATQTAANQPGNAASAGSSQALSTTVAAAPPSSQPGQPTTAGPSGQQTAAAQSGPQTTAGPASPPIDNGQSGLQTANNQPGQQATSPSPSPSAPSSPAPGQQASNGGQLPASQPAQSSSPAQASQPSAPTPPTQPGPQPPSQAAQQPPSQPSQPASNGQPNGNGPMRTSSASPQGPVSNGCGNANTGSSGMSDMSNDCSMPTPTTTTANAPTSCAAGYVNWQCTSQSGGTTSGCLTPQDAATSTAQYQAAGATCTTGGPLTPSPSTTPPPSTTTASSPPAVSSPPQPPNNMTCSHYCAYTINASCYNPSCYLYCFASSLNYTIDANNSQDVQKCTTAAANVQNSPATVTADIAMPPAAPPTSAAKRLLAPPVAAPVVVPPPVASPVIVPVPIPLGRSSSPQIDWRHRPTASKNICNEKPPAGKNICNNKTTSSGQQPPSTGHPPPKPKELCDLQAGGGTAPAQRSVPSGAGQAAATASNGVHHLANAGAASAGNAGAAGNGHITLLQHPLGPQQSLSSQTQEANAGAQATASRTPVQQGASGAAPTANGHITLQQRNFGPQQKTSNQIQQVSTHTPITLQPHTFGQQSATSQSHVANAVSQSNPSSPSTTRASNPQKTAALTQSGQHPGTSGTNATLKRTSGYGKSVGRRAAPRQAARRAPKRSTTYRPARVASAARPVRPAAHAITRHRSDIRLKDDIVALGRLDNGIGLYRFRYKGSDHTVYVGVMAQEVQTIVPSAVSRGRDGYLRVDYDRLGLQFMTWDQWVEWIQRP